MRLQKKTKIVITVGPASDTYNKIKRLAQAGANVVRLNFSHGTHEDHKKKIDIVRDLEKNEGIYLPILLDTRGPEIRTGLFVDGGVVFKKGQTFRISMKECLGTNQKFSVSHPGMYDDVKVKDRILIDDGNFEAVVMQKDQKTHELVCKASNTHLVKNRKSINLPASKLSLPYISKQDEDDLKFGCENDVDYIASSFTRRKQDILDIKKVIAKYGKPNIPIIAKIENPEGVSNIDDILNVADGIMVARGDLGVEIPSEDVPIIQREFVRKARRLGKPVITATQMLDSMQTHPRPTRAEVSDVFTAISESTDCVMLSAESASGEYPLEAVETQAKIARKTEQYLDYKELCDEAYYTSERGNNDAIANSIANTAILTNAKLIVTFTNDGTSAMRLAKARPIAPVLSLSADRKVVLRLGLVWGLYNELITSIPTSIFDMTNMARQYAYNYGLKRGDMIIVTGNIDQTLDNSDFLEIIKI